MSYFPRGGREGGYGHQRGYKGVICTLCFIFYILFIVSQMMCFLAISAAAILAAILDYTPAYGNIRRFPQLRSCGRNYTFEHQKLSFNLMFITTKGSLIDFMVDADMGSDV